MVSLAEKSCDTVLLYSQQPLQAACSQVEVLRILLVDFIGNHYGKTDNRSSGLLIKL